MLSEHVVRISDIGGISCIRLSSLLREQKFLSGMAFSNYEVFFRRCQSPVGFPTIRLTSHTNEFVNA